MVGQGQHVLARGARDHLAVLGHLHGAAVEEVERTRLGRYPTSMVHHGGVAYRPSD